MEIQLANLQIIVNGLNSLAEIEKKHPTLGRSIDEFVSEVRQCCNEAYSRFSNALSQVRTLPSNPSNDQIQSVCTALRDASNSTWFKEVSEICARLAALATRYDEPISKQIEYAESEHFKSSSQQPVAISRARYRLFDLLILLRNQETDLKNDIRSVVSVMQAKLGQASTSRDVEDARSYAVAVDKEIAAALDEISKISYQISGTMSVESILTKEAIAQQALQTPERVLIINMFFTVVIVALGATVFQFISFYQFVLLSGFTLTVVIVLNAFYLRTIDKLSDESFLKLMELAILKFFAPLAAKRTADSK